MATLWQRIAFYGESEVDPALRAEILYETALSEARIVILEVFLALIFGALLGFTDRAFRMVAIFTAITVVPLLVDAALRRNAAKRLHGVGPQPQ